jgi:hypothetical protein
MNAGGPDTAARRFQYAPGEAKPSESGMSPRLPPSPLVFAYRSNACISWSPMPLRPQVRRRIHAHRLLKF